MPLESYTASVLDRLPAACVLSVEVLPATTWDWVPTLSGGSFKWYIQRMAAAVQQLVVKYNSQVCLVSDSV